MEWRNEKSEMRNGGSRKKYTCLHVWMLSNLPSAASAILVLYLVCPSINECRRNPAVCMAFLLHSIV